MSDPAPAKRTSPATDVLKMLGEMRTVLTEMQAQQQHLVESETVLADVRDTISEAVKVMGASVRAQTKEPVVVHEGPSPLDKRWMVGGFVACGIFALIAGCLWWSQPRYTRYDGLGRALDAALVQHYSTLPKPMQEAVTTIYSGQGLQGPAQRKGNGK